MPTAADEVQTEVIPSNLGTRNLFCYFFTIRPHLDHPENQNMAGTKVQTSKV